LSPCRLFLFAAFSPGGRRIFFTGGGGTGRTADRSSGSGSGGR
jgi:hypothetical protein